MTIKKLAELAGVSTATVSNVMNDSKNVLPETRERVLKAIHESGYQPNIIAKSLRVKATRIIGVLVEDIRAFPTAPVISAISEYTGQHGYYILLYNLNMMENLLNRYDQIEYHKDKINDTISWLLNSARVDAVIYIGMFDRNITGIIKKIQKPLVVAYSFTDDGWNRCVTYDSENVSAEAADYLLGLGHKKIGIITGLAHTFPAKMRLSGIQRAFKEKGAVLDSSMVKNGNWSYQSGYDCMAELLELPDRPTAVFAMSDVMAFGAINAILDNGLTIPGDISVMGFDNREMTENMRPRLSTININLKEIGLNAAKLVIDLLGGVKRKENIISLPCELVLRDSVAKPGL